jgi:L-proline amide hydrolase
MVQEIHRRIPDVLWELFPLSSHMPHIEEPERFAGVLNSFLAEKLN